MNGQLGEPGEGQEQEGPPPLTAPHFNGPPPPTTAQEAVQPDNGPTTSSSSPYKDRMHQQQQQLPQQHHPLCQQQQQLPQQPTDLHLYHHNKYLTYFTYFRRCNNKPPSRFQAQRHQYLPHLKLPRPMRHRSIWLAYYNSSCNPDKYLYRLKDFHNKFTELLTLDFHHKVTDFLLMDHSLTPMALQKFL